MTKHASSCFLFIELEKGTPGSCPVQLHTLTVFYWGAQLRVRCLVQAHQNCWIVEAEDHMFQSFSSSNFTLLVHRSKLAFGSLLCACEFIFVFAFYCLWSSSNALKNVNKCECDFARSTASPQVAVISGKEEICWKNKSEESLAI